MITKKSTSRDNETRLLKSKHTGRDYRITIRLPFAYPEPRIKGWPFEYEPTNWPVVYLVDGDWYSGMVTEMIHPMAMYGTINDAIVVGIGYPENMDFQEAVRDRFALRMHDFLPVRDEGAEKWWGDNLKRPCPTGDAGNFLQFIKNELIPMVEKEYQVDPTKRILLGHSDGGLFTTFALFDEPGLFQNYIIGSPSLSYGNKFMFEREEQFSKQYKRLPTNVYFSVGELEESADDHTLTNTLQFATILKSRNHEGLSLHKQVFTDLNHCEVIAPGFQAGLKIALKK